MPFERLEANALGFTTRACLRFMIRWTECLHGNGSLRETLINFSDLVLADVVHLHRVNTVDGGQRSIATVDRSAPKGARPMIRVHGMALAGQTLSRAKPGTLWSMQELDRDAASRLEPRVMAWMEERGLREAMLIPLSSTNEKTDLLEFYMFAPVDGPRRLALETLCFAVAEAWSRRPEGRIARILRAAPAINANLAADRRSLDPLSPSNPLGFTAAELRICSMIQRGISLSETSKALSITESTLRSHLRSIFAKAGVAGQVGLVRLLVASQPSPTSLLA